MKISKLFHWLYAILMFLPFGLAIFNAFHGLFMDSSSSVDFDTWLEYLELPLNYGQMFRNYASLSIEGAYQYLFNNIFGIEGYIPDIIIWLLTYWTCISIIWLVFDVFMYVPLLVHRWIDKAKLE